jgi:outer membrane assembly lipoprotein YfiO
MCIAFIGIAGFSALGMTPQESVAAPDETIYETGLQYLENGQYEKARLAFQSLLNRYPDSDLAAASYFAIGATFYEEGGTENMQQAVERYKDFIDSFFRDPKVSEAQMKIISANMKLLGATDRDWIFTLRARQEFKRFLEKYPEHEFVPIVRENLKQIQEKLNKGEPTDPQNDQNNPK